VATPPEGPRPDDPWAGPPSSPTGGGPSGYPSSAGGYPERGPHDTLPQSGPHGAVPPHPAPYGQPYGAPYGAGPGARPRNGMGVAALVLGILGLILSFFVVGAVPGILAIIFGLIGRSLAKRREATNGGMALAGIITGVLAVLVAVGLVATVLSVLRPQLTRYQSCLRNAQTSGQQQECLDQFRRDLQNRFSR